MVGSAQNRVLVLADFSTQYFIVQTGVTRNAEHHVLLPSYFGTEMDIAWVHPWIGLGRIFGNSCWFVG